MSFKYNTPLTINKILLLTSFLMFLLNSSCNNEEYFVDSVIEEEVIEEDTNLPEDTDGGGSMILEPDSFSTIHNTPVTIDLFANDSDIFEHAVISFTDPIGGVISVNNNSTINDLRDDVIQYLPNANFIGEDTFDYTICDSQTGETCESANVSISIAPGNVIEDDLSGTLKAFPSAEGAGANASGGRGGIVIHVTNLNDFGSGSLRNAIRTNPETPRTIVFDVSGTIKASSPMDFSGIKNLTIAGQTAPEGGITIETPSFFLPRSENVILRYLRFVNTSYFYDGGIRATFSVSGANNVIIDHCSMRYSHISLGIVAQDDNDTENGQDNITFQRCIIADNHTGGIVGAIASGDRVNLAGKNSVHHNLFVNVDHRFPNVAGNSKAEIIENVIYNYRARLSTFFNNSESNLINNTYKAGPSSAFNAARHKIGKYIGGTPRVYTSGNEIIDESNMHSPETNTWNSLFVVWDLNDTAQEITAESESIYRQTSEFPDLGVPIERLGTRAAYTNVLGNVGTNAYLNADGSYGIYLDENDENYVSDVSSNTCWSCSSDGSHPNKTNISELNYPVIPSNTRSNNYDVDRDGMPDLWEIALFETMERDGRGDFDGDGYSDLEEFLNLVDK